MSSVSGGMIMEVESDVIVLIVPVEGMMSVGVNRLVTGSIVASGWVR